MESFKGREDFEWNEKERRLESWRRSTGAMCSTENDNEIEKSKPHNNIFG